MGVVDNRIDPVDAHVGRRLRIRRTLLGISQTQLAEALGVSFQQVQKYDRGANRVSASRLYDIGRILKVPVNFFFADMDPGEADPEDLDPAATDPLAVPELRSESLELLRSYWSLPDAALRRHFKDLMGLASRRREP
jgi:transcriptional regulator with XRE-family HTH domain